ncbi:type II secretion system F family protein [soil metagenome]
MSPLTLLAIFGLATLSAGGLAYAILYGRIQNENTTERRIGFAQCHGRAEARDRSAADPSKRRKSIQDTLKEVDEREKSRAKRNKAPPIATRMQQAGLTWTRRQFMLLSLVSGLVVFVVCWIVGLPLYAAAAIGVAGLLGVPRWIVNFLRKRRMNKFVDEFANAMDVIVRGVQAGLPLNDCIRIIAAESAEPVRSEFRQISETQAMGVTLADAIGKLPSRVPIPEANFFAIVIAIQQRAGGNLAEALGNLSRVLRERKKMKGKISAMSMEAKASGVIIGALPVVVMIMVYLTSPAYIMLLFTEPLGHVILGCAAVWMSTGIYVMRKMIRFDF